MRIKQTPDYPVCTPASIDRICPFYDAGLASDRAGSRPDIARNTNPDVINPAHRLYKKDNRWAARFIPQPYDLKSAGLTPWLSSEVIIDPVA